MSPHLHHALRVQSNNAITDMSSAKAPIHAVPWCGTDQPICLKGVGTGPCLGQRHQVRVSERDTQLPQRREFSIPGKTGHLLCYCRVPSCSERLLRRSSPLSGGSTSCASDHPGLPGTEEIPGTLDFSHAKISQVPSPEQHPLDSDPGFTINQPWDLQSASSSLKF